MMKGIVSPVDGSGTITIEPGAVQVNATTDFTITYKAATKIVRGYLLVQLPPAGTLLEKTATGDDSALEDLTLQKAERNAEGTEFDYGFVSDSGLPTGTTQSISVDGRTVVWGPLSLNKNGIFRRTIKRAKVKEDAGVLDWSVRFDAIGETEARPTEADAASGISTVQLYVLQSLAMPDDPDVRFNVVDHRDS